MRPTYRTAMWPTTDAAVPARMYCRGSTIPKDYATPPSASSRRGRLPRALLPHFLPACLPSAGHSGLVQKLQQQPADLLRLFLLHPMAGAVDQVTAEHPAAGHRLHRLDRAWHLVDPPI